MTVSETGTAIDVDRFLAVAEALALAAGKAIMEVRAQSVTARTKADQSPVTEADLRAERIVLDGLRAQFPQTG